MCGGTEPVGAECRVYNQSLTTPDETGDSISVACGVNGLQCQSVTGNPCQDYEVRYRCSAFEGQLHFQDVAIYHRYLTATLLELV